MDEERPAKDTTGLPFYHTSAQESVRLLELTPELATQLTGENPPKLLFKSAPVDPASNRASSTSHAVLCTDTETYTLRQVQTSNSVLITRPILPDAGDGAAEEQKSGIAYFSTPDCTLEMQKRSVDTVPFLLKVLTPYNGEDSDIQMVDVEGTSSNAREALFDDIPASTGECLTGWRDVVAFEYGGKCYLPAASAILAVLKGISSSASAQRVDITNPAKLNNLMDFVEDDEAPRALVEAVIRRISDPEGSSVQLDINATVNLTGRALLESRSKERAISKETFLNEWRDLLPEQWRENAGLDKIEGFYTEESPTLIKYRNPRAAATSTATKPAASRKWHEKFRRAQ